MITIVVASCISIPERLDYLNRCLTPLKKQLPDAEILIGFDKHGVDVEGATCYTHDHGMGHSWNWGIKQAKNNVIFQMEDDWFEHTNAIQERIDIGIDLIKDGDAFFRFTNMLHDWYKPGSIKVGDTSIKDRALYELNKCKFEDRCDGYNRYFYANHPHLKMKDFHDKVGYYLEDVIAPEVEIDMCAKVLKSNMRGFYLTENSMQHIGGASVREH